MYQIIRTRLREFFREPEAVFWVYGFPILMVVALGIAFRNKPAESVTVDFIESGSTADVVAKLDERADVVAQQFPEAVARTRLRTGKTDLVVVTKGLLEYDYFYDPARPESVVARNKINDLLQRAAGRADPAKVTDQEIDETGGRYIDFLVPGLLGLSLMGGGLWGVGFVTVDMRIRKLLKRFLATPMKRSHFLAGIMLSRMIFMVPEVAILLVFSRVAFGVVNHGSYAAVLVLVLMGAIMFSGLGLLVACRAKTLEAVNGLMNLVMLPMWMFSGTFFSSERFPEAVQPLVKALPLTPLINSLRAVMLEGAPLASQWPALATIVAWTVVSFTLALRWFRWF